MEKITSLTEEQKAQLKSWADKWKQDKPIKPSNESKIDFAWEGAD